MSGKPSIHTPEEFISGYRHHSKLWTEYQVSPSIRQIIFLNSASGYNTVTNSQTEPLYKELGHVSKIVGQARCQDHEYLCTYFYPLLLSWFKKDWDLIFSFSLKCPLWFFSILIFKNRSSALNWCSRIRFFMGFPEMSIVHWFLVVLRKWLNVVIRWWQGILLDWLSQEVIRNIFSFTYIW